MRTLYPGAEEQYKEYLQQHKPLQPNSLQNLTIRVIGEHILPCMYDSDNYLQNHLPPPLCALVTEYLKTEHPPAFIESYNEYCLQCREKNYPVLYSLRMWLIMAQSTNPREWSNKNYLLENIGWFQKT